MATKTISLSEDAYERLAAMKREGESFSDVVKRLTNRVKFRDVHGVLSEETADELAATVEARRRSHADRRATRQDELEETLEDA